VAALVSATGMTAPPHGEGVAAILAKLDLPNQPSAAGGCPLLKPIVILKAARTASTDLYDKLLEVLPGCNGYPEISHDDDLMRHGCTAKAYQYQEAVWRDALRRNAIITHNPSTQGGGCFSSYFDGEDRLTELLAAENATVVSWTRNNVLRQRYSEYLTAATKDFGTTNVSSKLSKAEHGFVKWNATGKEVVSEVVNGACEMLAIQSAAKKCSSQHHRHVVYEEYAKDPWTALKRVLSWADLKEGVTASQLMLPHRDALKTRPDELAFAGSFAYAFERPDEVFQSLQAVCLDWTFWGGSFTSIHTPRPMCLSAPSCEKAGLPCFCDKPDVVHSTRNAVWLGHNQSQPDWWLEQTPETEIHDQLAGGVSVGSETLSSSPTPATKAAKEYQEYLKGASPAKPKDGEEADVAELQKRLGEAELARGAAEAELARSAAASPTTAATALPATAAPAVTDVVKKPEDQEDQVTNPPYIGKEDVAANAVPAATTMKKQQDTMKKQQDTLFEEYVQKQGKQQAPDQHLGWVWRDGHYVWQDAMMVASMMSR